MFDATYPPTASGPTPPRPRPVDIYPFLPMLRARAAKDAVELLALAAAENILCTKRWMLENWGADADVRDLGHPAHTAALDPSSPPFKLAEAQAALAEACSRYRTSVGRDGLTVARQCVTERYGAAVADYVLEPIAAHVSDWTWLDDMLAKHEPAPWMPTPEATPAERRRATRELADRALSDPDRGDLQRHLEALQAACEAEAGDPHGLATAAAIQAVGASVAAALERADEEDRVQMAEHLQTTLDLWADGTGGPVITVTVE